MWHLPLPQEYRKDLDSEIADLKNITGTAAAGPSPPGCSSRSSPATSRGSTSTSPGPARASGDDGYLAKGGTGFGVRTLVEVLSTFEKPKAATKR